MYDTGSKHHVLKRRDIAPPGGFRVLAPTGARFTGSTFSEVEAKLSAHLEANGCLPQDAAELIDRQNAKRLLKGGYNKWVTVK